MDSSMSDAFMPMALEKSLYSTATSRATATEDIYQELKDQGIKINTGDNMGLDFSDYLQLMVQQLQNQTIDNNVDTAEMMNQLVQMSVVQMMGTVKTSIDTLVDANTLTYAASLVGKTVTVGQYDDKGNLQEIVGTVTGTGTYQGMPVIFINDQMYALSDIMAVGTLPATPEKPPESGEGSGEGAESAGGVEGGEGPAEPEAPEGTEPPAASESQTDGSET